eukprot:TRINITY_DN14965_c0_g1_i1.p1 TRINITY_DN14965_c0_g1~~TRINITY_DN14965_c0_g1_i1.p1  ORF type:complete len:308 (-),score=37.74 TRINITY_DN14965_c0_g1_i1:71-925(-)
MILALLCRIFGLFVCFECFRIPEGFKEHGALSGGMHAQTVIGTYKGKKVVVKTDEEDSISREAATMQAILEEEWGGNLLPLFIETSKNEIVMEWLEPPGENEECGWQTLGSLVTNKDRLFSKVRELSFSLAAKYWSDLLLTMQALKENGWHHGDLHVYNIMVNPCESPAKLIDWDRAYQEPAKQPVRGFDDTFRLLQAFLCLFRTEGNFDASLITILLKAFPKSKSEKTVGMVKKLLIPAVSDDAVMSFILLHQAQTPTHHGPDSAQGAARLIGELLKLSNTRE